MKARLFSASFIVGLGTLSFVACDGGSLPSSAFDASDGAFDTGQLPTSDASLPTFEDSGPTPLDGSAEFACFTASTRAGCRQCCHELHATGRAEFIRAVNECVCQPSKCGAVCAASACNATPSNPPSGDPCIACFNRESAGQGDGAANPSLDAATSSDAGGLYPDRGIQNCAVWASDKCRANADCLEAETCKARSRCNDKPETAPRDASGD